MRALLLLVLSISAFAQSTVTWTRIDGSMTGTPAHLGYMELPPYDPVSQKILHWANPPGSGSIYSSTWYYLDLSTLAWTRMFGHDSMGPECTADKPDMPGNRHPYGNFALDSNRNRIWFTGGVMAPCDGAIVNTSGASVTWTCCGSNTFHSSWAGENVVINGITYEVASVESPTALTLTESATTQTGVLIQLSNPPPNFKFMYYMSLNADPATNTWTRITTPTVPTATDGNLEYDPQADVLIYYGNAGGWPKTWAFCPVDEGESLTAAQLSAGCDTPNDWELVVDGAVVSPLPKGEAGAYGGMFYVPSVNRIIHYGGQDGSNISNETWSYNTTAKTWTQMCQGGCTPPPLMEVPSYIAQPSIAYIGAIDKVLYHDKDANGDYLYDPVADTWTQITTVGNGPSDFSMMVYNSTTQKVIAYESQGIWWEADLGIQPATGQFRILGTWPSGNAKWLEVCGLVPTLSAGGTATVTLTGPGGLSIPLTIQEAIYPGASGVARTDEPFCMGVPLADAAGITSTTGLALTGTTQVAADNMATDGDTISVDTGAAVFGVRKANTNIIDTVTVGGISIVATSSAETRGLVLMGPDPAAGTVAGKVTCSPDAGGTACTHLYSSTNDASSTCSIEKNGPIAAVVKCEGSHKTSSGSAYLDFTTRTYFYRGKASVKVTSILRNARYDTSATPSPDRGANAFNPAFKGFQSYELRIAPGITGTLNYTIAGHAGNQTGDLSGSDEAYVYQAYSQKMYPWNNISPENHNTITADEGYLIKENSTTLASGTNAAAQAVPGWADISDAAGKGITIGFYQMAGHYPKSLEFVAGGADVRLGIWPRHNSKPTYQAWPQWGIYELYLGFHAEAVTANEARDEFLRSQHYLLARAPRTHYNTSGVFPFPIADPAQEDAYYVSRVAASNPSVSAGNYCYGGGSSNCVPDLGTADSVWPLTAWRDYAWHAGGQSNQSEYRWGNLLGFIKRGSPGRFLDSAHFYRFQAERVIPHSDGFTWRSRPDSASATPELNSTGRPHFDSIGVLNSDKSYISWFELGILHAHWWGMADYYFLSGDETIRDALDSMKDYYLNPMTLQGAVNGTGNSDSTALYIVRQVGIHIASAGVYGEYLRAIGDSDYAGVWAQGELNYELLVRPDVCVSGYPAGCTPPAETSTAGTDPPGISRVRGYPGSFGGRVAGWCTDTSGYRRGVSAFQAGILVESLLIYRHMRGAAWQYYVEALDLAYGVGQWATSEAFSDDASTAWSIAPYDWYNGFRYGVWADKSGKCPGGTPIDPDYVMELADGIYDVNLKATQNASVWMSAYVQYLATGSTAWQRKVNLAFDRLSFFTPYALDKGGVQMGALVYALNADSQVLQDVPFSVSDLGGGNYRLTFTTPASASDLRVKWADKAIAPHDGLLGYDVFTQTFALSPDTYSTWFGATNVDATATPGVEQFVDVSTGAAGLTEANFSVMAMADEAPAGVSRSIKGARTVRGGTLR